MFKEEEQKLGFMASNVLALVFKMAVNGDLKACKLFLEYSTDRMPSTIGTYIDKQQNNFNTILTPEVIESLTPQQVIDIEAVITTSS